VTESTNNPAGVSKPAAPARRLLTEKQLLAELSDEVAASSLTAVSRKYNLQVSQVSDILRGKANLSKRVVTRLSLRLHKFYERVSNG
jgi:plasmid maintenance system antidote protein VapI